MAEVIDKRGKPKNPELPDAPMSVRVRKGLRGQYALRLWEEGQQFVIRSARYDFSELWMEKIEQLPAGAKATTPPTSPTQAVPAAPPKPVVGGSGNQEVIH